jgi:hypothetical protein
MKSGLKNKVLEVDILRKIWAKHRANQLVKRYRGWAQKYGKLADEMGLVYTEEIAKNNIRSYIKRCGATQKLPGEFHTAAFFLTHDWGIGVLSELEELGPVSVFDYQKQGFSIRDSHLQSRLPELNNLMVRFLRETHARRPIDWILCTHSGGIILRDTIRRIREELGIPIVNQWLDCKQSFEAGMGPHGQDMGQKDIAPEFDLVWTSSRSVCEWYMVVGARPFFLPEGFSPAYTPRISCKKTSDVGFFGQCYGLRPDYIAALRRAGLSVAVAGYGWKGFPEISVDKVGDFIGSCKVNLGMGGVGYSMDLTTLKGRDFEVPGAGGAYLTTYNPDLASFYHIGKEILCYHSMDEMVDLALQLVRDEALRESLADNAYARAMKEHRWKHRFTTVLEILDLIKGC